jgi:thiamine biosynthesis lipoprotein
MIHMKSFESMGTHFRVTVWDDISIEEFDGFMNEVMHDADDFDHAYSRFKKDSFVWSIADVTGIVEVPRAFMEMLVHYYRGYLASGKKINPLIGFTIADLGYDDEYSLTPKDVIRKTPDLLHAVRIIDSNHIELNEKALFDFGAIGKGYFVDRIAKSIRRRGWKKFLVDGSGDTMYDGGVFEGNPAPLSVGLEDPRDTSKVIGRITMYKGAMAASAINRRAWKDFHHYIDPHESTSTNQIIATWVTASDCVTADFLASALFFAPADKLKGEGYEFEWCAMNKEGKIGYSEGFNAEFY